MKVVINACFGGFGLSPEATIELWKRGGPVDATPVEVYFGGRLNSEERLGGKGALRKWREYLATPEDKRESQSRIFLRVFTPDESAVLRARRDDEFRSDPKLVALVEEWGKRANGPCSALRVVEIPDGIDYEISEYDGSEHIAEKHRTWG